MKKMIMALAAVFTFGIASAQTDPKQPPTPPAPQTPPAAPDDKKTMNSDVTPDVITNENVKPDEAQPRKPEMKTRGHVKSTPDADRLKRGDTIRKKTFKKASAKKKS